MTAKLLAYADRHWRLIVLLAWLAMVVWMIVQHWGRINGFALGDTDDNLRMSQVRALLAGQNWYDLRQHRLDGSNIHWSRLVDLPIAGLILAGRLFVSGAVAEKIAVTIAPLLPYLLLLYSLALTSRRLIHPLAYLAAIATLFFAGSTNGMFTPLRIDHHGWQLALLALALSAVADPRRLRGGVVLGVATALSFSIGLEMMIYLALLGVGLVLLWIADEGQRQRLAGYGVTLAGGVAFGFLLFASYANRAPVCDALSPVWLSDAMLAGALLFLMSWISPASSARRLLLAAAAGIGIATFHALAWSHCLARLEGVSPELNELWLSHVREARPIYRHGWRTAVLVSSLPIIGIIGWLLWAWVQRGDPDRARRTLAVAVPALASALLLLWQTRAGPAAQLLAIGGAVALGWLIVPMAWRSRFAVVRILGTSAAVILVCGALVPLIVDRFPEKPKSAAVKKMERQSGKCPTLAGMRPIARLPKGKVFTFVDLSPRLITITHHSAITGPYHRNGADILDVQHAFRGSAGQARQIIARHDADYVLICPGIGEATIYASEAKRGFYSQLAKGRAPEWLEPISLPQGSPFKMWRVRREAESAATPS